MSSSLDVAKLPVVARVSSRVEQTWKALDSMLLRLQGRVDTPSYDRGLPYAFAVLLSAVLITISLARQHSLLHGEDTAKFAQATWQIAEGMRPVTTLSGGHLVAEQGSLILYPLAALTAFLPRTETLLVIKALALALTIIPLWRLARRHARLGIGVCSVVVVVYALYSSVHFMNAADFAPAVIAMPALMWAVLFAFDDRRRMMVVAILVALCCRADLGLAIAGLGILLLLERRRATGRTCLVLGLGWFALSIYVLQPLVGDGTFGFLQAYSAFGETPGQMLWGIISHPGQFLDVVRSLSNFRLLVSLFAPVLFLPLTTPRYLMPGVPLYILYLGADVEVNRLSEAAQTVPITVFVFVATVFALERAGTTLVKRVRVERRIILALLLTALVFFVSDSPTSPYREPWEWGDRDDLDRDRIAAIAELPGNNVPVRASSTLLPLLSERLGVFALDTTTSTTLEELVIDATDQVDWLLLDRDVEGLSPDDIARFRTNLRLRGWERVERSGDTNVEVFEFTGVVTAE